MKAMKNLLRLDLLKMRSLGAWMLGYVLLLSCLVADARTAPLGSIIFFYLAISIPMSYDEQSKNGYLLATLPVTRREIVHAKYLYALLTCVAVCLVITVSTLLAGLLFGDRSRSALPLLPVLSLTGVLYVSLMMPLLLCLGVTKSRVWLLVLYGLAIAGTTFFSGSGFVPPHISGVVVILVTVIAFVISYLIAAHFYERRQFTE